MREKDDRYREREGEFVREIERLEGERGRMEKEVLGLSAGLKEAERRSVEAQLIVE